MKLLVFTFLAFLSFGVSAKEYDCSGLKWFYPGGTNRYQPKVKVIVKNNTIQVDVIAWAKGGSTRDTHFSESVFKKTESTTKYGVETERTLVATNGKESVEFTSNILGFGYIHLKHGNGYGFYGKCD